MNERDDRILIQNARLNPTGSKDGAGFLHAVFLDQNDLDDGANRITNMIEDIMGPEWFHKSK